MAKYVVNQIDEYIKTRGKGNTRDALNVALAEIDRLQAEVDQADILLLELYQKCGNCKEKIDEIKTVLKL